MDIGEMLPQLEDIARKINFQPLDDLLVTIRDIYEHSVMHVPASDPIHTAKGDLLQHHTTFVTLSSQFEQSLPRFQTLYTGQAGESYHTTALTALQGMQTVRDHLDFAAQQHQLMADNFALADEMKGVLIALCIALAVTLGVLVFSAGTTAEVTVPAAALEAAGAGGTIFTMETALTAAYTALGSLITSFGVLNTLGVFAATFAAAELLMHPGIVQAAMSSAEAELIAGVFGIPVDLVKKLLEAGIDVFDEETWQLVKNLLDAFPNLTQDDIVKLVVAIVTGGLSVSAVLQTLSQLCGGLPGIADTLVNALRDPASDDATLLNKILNTARSAQSGNIGDQRVMAVLKQLGVDNVADVGQKIPGSDADIVTKGGVGIEVGGPGKAFKDFINQLTKYVQRFGKSGASGKVQVYLEDDGSADAQQAINDAKRVVGSDNVHTFSPDDRMCVK